MAEFKEVMKQWKRLCNWMDNKYSPDPICSHCPLAEIVDGGCSAIYELYHDYDYDKMAEIIMKWAKDNPEPEYPTWEQYLVDLMMADMKADKTDNPNSVENYMRKTPIPTDIAEKLGIKPKEDK